MFNIVEGNSYGLQDVQSFVALVNSLPNVGPFFEPDRDIIVTRAPGRLDVMGGIADYSGSLVLEMPIAEATLAAIQRNASDAIVIVSVDHDGKHSSIFKMPLADLMQAAELRDLVAAREYFTKRIGGDWASYVAGAFFVLAKELGIRFDSGARIVVGSEVPIGKGVSSSAALEVSAMQAICNAYEIDVAPRDLALLCQKVENHIVGAACGVMDQITSHCGEAGKLTSIVCQPAEILGTHDIPDEVEFWGIDSGVRHAVSGSDYSTVRTGAFMGYRIIAELAGLSHRDVGNGKVEIDDPRWNGYLANVSPAEYEKKFAGEMPRSMNGEEFLLRFRGITDTVTTIDPSKAYAIRAPAEHAVYENARVHRFAELMTKSPTEHDLIEAGEVMFESHESYKACGLTEPRTDRIIDLVRGSRGKGLFGARITGGGSGGTVAVLARRDSRGGIDRLAKEFSGEAGEKPFVFQGSSPGCSLFGQLRLRGDLNARKVAE